MKKKILIIIAIVLVGGGFILTAKAINVLNTKIADNREMLGLFMKAQDDILSDYGIRMSRLEFHDKKILKKFDTLVIRDKEAAAFLRAVRARKRAAKA